MPTRDEVKTVANSHTDALLDYIDAGNERVQECIDQELRKNAVTIRELSERFNQYVADHDAKNKKAAELLGGLQELLGTSIADHQSAVKNPTPTKVEEAKQSTATTQSAFTDWDEWREAISATVRDHEQRIRDLEAQASLDNQKPEPATKESENSEEETTQSGLDQLDQMITHPVPPREARQTSLNPKNWNVVTWVAAIAGMLLGVVLMALLPTSYSTTTLAVIMMIVKLLVVTFSFFVGGLIGSHFDQRRHRSLATA